MPSRRHLPSARQPRQLATYLAYRGLGAALERVPEPVGRAATIAATQVLSSVNYGARHYAEAHLHRVLATSSPVVEPDPAVVRRWVRRSIRAYGRYWAEGARLASVPLGEVARYMVVESGMEHLVAGMEAGRGVVMALPHVGSWEWGGAFLASEGMPMTSVAERVEPAELFDWFLDQRAAMGLNVVPLDSHASGVLLHALRDGRLVGLLCDRDIGGNGVEVELFGERTTLPAGPATLALRTGAALVAAAVYTGPGAFHTGVISAPLHVERTGRLRDDVQRLTQGIAEHFEAFIRRQPEQWHLFQPNWPSDVGGEAPRTVGRPGATGSGGPISGGPVPGAPAG